MACQQPWRSGTLQTFCVLAMRLQQLSLVIHRFFFPVSRSLIMILHSNGYKDSSEYLFDISHPAPSASEVSVCSVEPGSVEDVSKIVRSSDLMQQPHLPTHIIIDTYPWIKANAICSEGWRARREPRILLDDGCTDYDDTLQRDKI